MKPAENKTYMESGLILEGGGMRGIFVAGVLDFFMEKGLQFSECYGVSAGACHLTSYMSGQIGRALRISTVYLDDPEYCSFKSLIKTGDFFGVDFCYDKIPNLLDSYDYDAAAAYPGNCYAVATNIVNGRAEYLPLKDLHKDIAAVQASSSLPLISRNVEFNGKLLLDGGAADSIPVYHSVKAGNRKNVVVLTQPKGHVKKPIPAAMSAMLRARYKEYPGIVNGMEKRHLKYNKTLRYIKMMEEKGEIFVFRPEMLVHLDRIERDPNKVKILYMEGYQAAANRYEEMMRYLEA